MKKEENSKQQEKVAVVTGSSSGMGYETSLALARNGFLTYATMRNPNKAENIKSVAIQANLPIRIIQLDVTDDLSVNNAVQSILSETGGRIDVLVNNAGYGLTGAFEDLVMDEIKAQYETNVFGLIRTTQAVLPTMRRQKSGVIVNISSGTGRFGYPGGSAYVSSKFAVEGLSESMAYELEPFGIKVIIIEPGVIKTNAFNNAVVAKKSQDPNSPYSPILQSMGSGFEEMVKNASSPELVTNVILEAITNDNPNLRYLVGTDSTMIIEARKNMSDREFQNLVKKQFNLL